MLSKNFFLQFLSLLAAACLFFTSCRTVHKTGSNAEIAKTENPAADSKEVGKVSNTGEVGNTRKAASTEGKETKNSELYNFIDEWLGVPYKYGGRSKSGVDCSNFASLLYNEVFEKSLAGSSASMINLCTIVEKEALKEGDLVFFKINQDKVSHVGVYLNDNKFVHATTQKGVMINDLGETYYKKYFYKAGRVK